MTTITIIIVHSNEDVRSTSSVPSGAASNTTAVRNGTS